MQLKPITAIIVLSLIVVSFSIAGCTFPITTSPSPTASYPFQVPSQTPTATPPADLSSYFGKALEGGNAIVVRPFTKSTNERGNDVYKGITKNSSKSGSLEMTTVIELTRSKGETKQLFDKMVAQKINEGFTPRPDWIAASKAESPNLTDAWYGQQYGSGEFFVVYYYDSYASSWLFLTEAN